MRLLGARSEWDMRAAAALASAVLIVVMWCNVSLGVMGKALYPGLAHVDSAFPRLFVDHLDGLLAGLVLAGVLAACLSTYDSIGSALGAVFTRDVFCRFLAPEAGEGGILRATRAASVACIAVSFLYVPFLGEGMVAFYLRLSSVAIVPLATVFAAGVLTAANRQSGVAGMGCGNRLRSRFDARRPFGLALAGTGRSASGGATCGRSSSPAVRWRSGRPLRGRAGDEALRGLTLASCRRGERYGGAGAGWLETSRASVASETAASEARPSVRRPERFTLALVAGAAIVFFAAFH